MFENQAIFSKKRKKTTYKSVRYMLQFSTRTLLIHSSLFGIFTAHHKFCNIKEWEKWCNKKWECPPAADIPIKISQKNQA